MVYSLVQLSNGALPAEQEAALVASVAAMMTFRARESVELPTEPACVRPASCDWSQASPRGFDGARALFVL